MFGVRWMQSPAVVWKTALPGLSKIYTSPDFILNLHNNNKAKLTIFGDVFGPRLRPEFWRVELKLEKETTASETGVTFYVEKTNGELFRFFVGPITVRQIFTLHRTELRRLGISGDILSMIFVFDIDIKCSMDVSKEDLGMPENEVKNSKQAEAEEPSVFCLQHFSKDAEKLFDNQEHSDAIINCGNRTFSVNRNILSARSEVFSAMFRNKMAENQNGIVEISDMESSILEQFLRFVYSGRLDSISMDTAFELYRAGDKYAVPSLKQMCTTYLESKISENNVCQILLLADMFNEDTLMERAISFVTGTDAFLKSTPWNDFAKHHTTLAVKVYQKYFMK